jgi:hypothetical protein
MNQKQIYEKFTTVSVGSFWAIFELVFREVRALGRPFCQLQGQNHVR